MTVEERLSALEEKYRLQHRLLVAVLRLVADSVDVLDLHETSLERLERAVEEWQPCEI